jgi:hypothetical protein
LIRKPTLTTSIMRKPYQSSVLVISLWVTMLPATAAEPKINDTKCQMERHAESPVTMRVAQSVIAGGSKRRGFALSEPGDTHKMIQWMSKVSSLR